MWESVGGDSGERQETGYDDDRSNITKKTKTISYEYRIFKLNHDEIELATFQRKFQGFRVRHGKVSMRDKLIWNFLWPGEVWS